MPLSRREFFFVGVGLPASFATAMMWGKIAHELREQPSSPPIKIASLKTLDTFEPLITQPVIPNTPEQEISERKNLLENYLDRVKLSNGQKLKDITPYEVRPINAQGRIQYGEVIVPVQTRTLPALVDEVILNEEEANLLLPNMPISWQLEIVTPRGAFIARFKRFTNSKIPPWIFNARMFDNKFFIKILR